MIKFALILIISLTSFSLGYNLVNTAWQYQVGLMPTFSFTDLLLTVGFWILTVIGFYKFDKK